MSRKMKYVVVSNRRWNKKIFDGVISRYPGKWIYISDRKKLNMRQLRRMAPRYIFFLHWSWKVPAEIVKKYECINFHMTDVPYGRGGSPLQNLIARGRATTMLTALRMAKGLDSGPVYMKRPLSLKGRAEDVYIRAGRLAASMIKEILFFRLEPVPQQGKVVLFKRRRPWESRLPRHKDLTRIYDHIRMLDADGYPKAFLDYGGFRYLLSNADLKKDKIMANVEIIRIQRGAPK